MPDPIRYLFIDGAYLRGLLDDISKRYFRGEAMEVDFENISRSFKKAFYYDCLPGKRQGEETERHATRVRTQQKLFEQLRTLPGWHVYEGTVRGQSGRLRQKQVDTMMAVDMMAHSYRRNASEVTLIAGDLDFKPVLDALVQDGMYVTLWYDRRHASQELIDAADNRHALSIHTVKQWLSKGFNRSHPLPSPHSTPQNEVADHALVAFGVLSRGRRIELYQKDNTFSAVFEEGHNEGYRMYVVGTSRELVEKYVEDAYEPFTWDTRPQVS